MILKALADFFSQYPLEPHQTCWMAYSGGLDSHVLLSLSVALRETMPLSLAAIHINHGFSPYAKQWARHCKKTCEAYQVDYVEENINVSVPAGESVEAFARKKRYALFSTYLKPGDFLLTAHHQDDQAETLLLQLCRGSGLKGLSSMPAIKPFSTGFHGRPLLHFSREDLLQYAHDHGLKWIEDESNQEIKFQRNFIRHEVMPVLKKTYPSISKMLSRSAKHAAEAEALLDYFATQTLDEVKGSVPHTLSIAKLAALTEPLQKLMLRTWIVQRGHLLPNAKKMSVILHELIPANRDRQPIVRWKGAQLRRFRDVLYLLKPSSSHQMDKPIQWDGVSPLRLPGIGVLSARSAETPVLVSVQFRQGGEQLFIAEKGCHRTLKNLFQEWGVPTWERDKIPLIYEGDRLVSVVGYYGDSAYRLETEQDC